MTTNNALRLQYVICCKTYNGHCKRTDRYMSSNLLINIHSLQDNAQHQSLQSKKFSLHLLTCLNLAEKDPSKETNVLSSVARWKTFSYRCMKLTFVICCPDK